MKVFLHGDSAIVCMTVTQAKWVKVLASLNHTVPEAIKTIRILGERRFTDEQIDAVEFIQDELHKALTQGGVE